VPELMAMASPVTRAVSSKSEQVVCSSSATESLLVSHTDAHPLHIASYESSVQGMQCAEVGILQGRIAREPVDRSRYVVVNSNGGTVFACSRCSKQYIHRKSLNKHWNDKHVDEGIDGSKYLAFRTQPFSEPHKNLFAAALVHCPSETKQVTHSCNSSLIRSAIQSYAVSSTACSVVPVANSQQKIYRGQHDSQTKHSGTVRDSVLWHSLAAIHLNQEHDLNSFYCAPLPAHSGGHSSDRGSFASQMFCDDDCQVLDLSKRSSGMREQSLIYLTDDVPLDLSLKSDSLSLADSERPDLSLHGTPETVSKSVTHCKEISTVTPRLNKPKRANEFVGKTGESVKGTKLVQLDSVSLLRRLRSGILTNASNNHPVLGDSDNCKASSSLSGKNDVECEPSTKYECHLGLAHFKNNLKVISEIPNDLATAEETHNFFGGISRGGHIRCKKCEFSATSMLVFSQHVAQHVRKPKISSGICDSVQNQCGNGTDQLEDIFFSWLGLHRTDGVVCDEKSSVKCCHSEADSIDKDQNLVSGCNTVVTDVSEFSMPEVHANGFGSDHGLQKNNQSSDSVRQKPGAYRRGLGLTTTESRDAAGRSWRRRRLRTCERCGYVTDNLTTLKRHEEKHGAQGMYRCKLCDYTVNQQHILEYHTRNVHAHSRQIGAGNSATLVGGGHQESLSKEKKVSACNSHVVKGHSFQHAVNKCKIMSKIVMYPTSVTVVRRHMLDAFGLQLSQGICVRCGFRTLSSVRMKLHMLQHPHERYACSQCPHTSATVRLLSKHRIQHTDCDTGHLAQKTYMCPECPFTAASPQRLRCHARFHAVKFRHVCCKCSYSVDRANLMAQHQRLHMSASASIKQHWLHCSKCPFKTVNRFNLVNHERGHYAVNCQYMCHLCSFGIDVANVALGHQRLHSCAN